ncbi:TetR family transcriptional regulator C-terminal domain-containing protein [Streptomyces sp. PA03-1a]|nr:TetR family transcriptional regulator C-terminal domain-containing protein [Streptomyces sp. PA03-1a]MDX2814065.1 TetR family transcriptional regulator C-terminal domain-containing protein [Streptomyces sp. PA03-5A]
MSTAQTSRPELIADTALALLAERGMRGLTHRAVDEAAGLPQGSTSNHARTRAALLEAAVRRLAFRESQTAHAPASAPGPEGLAALLAHFLHRSVTEARDLTRARLELALEATRRPELRTVYDTAGRAFREQLEAMLRAVGSAEPERHARSLIAWCDGVLFHSVAGAGSTSPPPEAELRAGAADLLRGMLGGGSGGSAG